MHILTDIALNQVFYDEHDGEIFGLACMAASKVAVALAQAIAYRLGSAKKSWLTSLDYICSVRAQPQARQCKLRIFELHQLINELQ